MLWDIKRTAVSWRTRYRPPDEGGTRAKSEPSSVITAQVNKKLKRWGLGELVGKLTPTETLFWWKDVKPGREVRDWGAGGSLTSPSLRGGSRAHSEWARVWLSPHREEILLGKIVEEAERLPTDKMRQAFVIDVIDHGPGRRQRRQKAREEAIEERATEILNGRGTRTTLVRTARSLARLEVSGRIDKREWSREALDALDALRKQHGSQGWKISKERIQDDLDKTFEKAVELIALGAEDGLGPEETLNILGGDLL